MGLAGVPVYLTTAVLPVILTAVGLTDEVHLFWHYQIHLDRQPDRPREALRRTLDEVVGPITLTGLTTFCGFLSFSASPIAPVQAFSVFTSLGILFCMLWSVTVVPAMLAFLPARWMRRTAAPATGAAPGRVVRALHALARRPRIVLAALGALSLLAFAGLARLEVQDSWIEGFSAGSPFRRDTAFVNRAFSGTHLLVAHVGFPRGADREAAAGEWRGPLVDPAVLQAVARFEDAARALPGVGGVLGPWSHLLAVTTISVTYPEMARAELATGAGIARTLTRFDAVRGAHRRREVISDDLREGLVTVFLKDANFRDTARLMDRLRAAAREHLGGAGGGLGFAGDVGVSQAMIPAIVRTQVTSLLLTLLTAFLVVALLERSPVRAFFAVLPAALAVAWVFGAMGWTGLPLGVATSMFCAITLGIGVDFAIHLLDRVRRLRAEGAAEPMARALEEAGPAIVGDTLAVALGFGVLAFSRVPPNGRLGLLVAGALLASCLLALVGLPALIGKGVRTLFRGGKGS
jgi:predicted RND superfamily exporter protein